MESFHERHHIAVREPRPVRGTPVPLFDRLVGGSPESPITPAYSRVLPARALRDSVLLDVSRLLNTRCGLRGALRELAKGTVLDYGLPDFSALSAASEGDLKFLAQSIASQITAYEPRLRNVSVVLLPHASNPKAVQGVIDASLLIGKVYEPVTFQIEFDPGNASPVVSLS
jgi:type VI secretion system protein ImpF